MYDTRSLRVCAIRRAGDWLSFWQPARVLRCFFYLYVHIIGSLIIIHALLAPRAIIATGRPAGCKRRADTAVSLLFETRRCTQAALRRSVPRYVFIGSYYHR